MNFNDKQTMRFCQSCGMPILTSQDCGTEQDGSRSFDYCVYCYQQGDFLQDCTMEEMIVFCADVAVKQGRTKPEELEKSKEEMREWFKTMKRWKKN